MLMQTVHSSGSPILNPSTNTIAELEKHYGVPCIVFTSATIQQGNKLPNIVVENTNSKRLVAIVDTLIRLHLK